MAQKTKLIKNRQALYDPSKLVEKSKRLEQQKEEIEKRGCTFQPNINKKSKHLAKRIADQTKSVHDRLYDHSEARSPIVRVSLYIPKDSQEPEQEKEENKELEQENQQQEESKQQQQQQQQQFDESADKKDELDKAKVQREWEKYEMRQAFEKKLSAEKYKFQQLLKQQAEREERFQHMLQQQKQQQSLDKKRFEEQLERIQHATKRLIETENNTQQTQEYDYQQPQHKQELQKAFMTCKYEGATVKKQVRRGNPHFSHLSFDEYSIMWTSKTNKIKRIGWEQVVNVISGKRVNNVRSGSVQKITRSISSPRRFSLSKEKPVTTENKLFFTIICESRDLTFEVFDKHQRDRLMMAVSFGLSATREEMTGVRSNTTTRSPKRRGSAPPDLFKNDHPNSLVPQRDTYSKGKQVPPSYQDHNNHHYQQQQQQRRDIIAQPLRQHSSQAIPQKQQQKQQKPKSPPRLLRQPTPIPQSTFKQNSSSSSFRPNQMPIKEEDEDNELEQEHEQEEKGDEEDEEEEEEQQQPVPQVNISLSSTEPATPESLPPPPPSSSTYPHALIPAASFRSQPPPPPPPLPPQSKAPSPPRSMFDEEPDEDFDLQWGGVHEELLVDDWSDDSE